MKNQSALLNGTVSQARVESLQVMANRLRRHSLISTAEAASGHPSTCLSCAELMATIFFQFMRYDVHHPHDLNNDRFVLSKGHAAPIQWAALAEAGAFPAEKLKTLRRIDSDLEGHPTPRTPWVDVATGSLGQGLADAVGMAIASRLDKRDNRIWVMMGDGEIAEGSVWEAAELASFENLGRLIAFVDVNRYGQSRTTMYEHNLDTYADRFSAFGWHTQQIDGHNIEEIIQDIESALQETERPSMILAKTMKGKGVSFMEDKPGWHGKPVKKGEELEKALAEVGDTSEMPEKLTVRTPEKLAGEKPKTAANKMAAPEYKLGDKIATREAYGDVLKKLGAVNPDIVAVDADVENSTFTEKFSKVYPDRLVECYIAEQNLIGVSMGLGALGKIPFAATFACFTTRAFDQLRMAGISQSNIKVCGSHSGVSIGEDGPSQMGLEDLAMMRTVHGSTVLYPSDAVSCERLVELAAQTPGIVYIRTTRPKTATIYSANEEFRAGGSKTVRSSSDDKATVIGAGITLHKALEAYEQLKKEGIAIRVIDLYSIKPVDEATLRQAARETGAIITVEDHYPQGGIGEAVLSAIAGENCRYKMLAVNGLPRSGDAEALMDMYGISTRHIVEAVRELVKK